MLLNSSAIQGAVASHLWRDLIRAGRCHHRRRQRTSKYRAGCWRTRSRYQKVGAAHTWRCRCLRERIYSCGIELIFHALRLRCGTISHRVASIARPNKHPTHRRLVQIVIARRGTVQRAIPRLCCGRAVGLCQATTQRIAKRIRSVAKSYPYRPRCLTGRGFAARRTIQNGGFLSRRPRCAVLGRQAQREYRKENAGGASGRRARCSIRQRFDVPALMQNAYNVRPLTSCRSRASVRGRCCPFWRYSTMSCVPTSSTSSSTNFTASPSSGSHEHRNNKPTIRSPDLNDC